MSFFPLGSTVPSPPSSLTVELVLELLPVGQYGPLRRPARQREVQQHEPEEPRDVRDQGGRVEQGGDASRKP